MIIFVIFYQVVVPFGFGLSYTSFHYSELGLPATASACDDINLTVTVQNTGSLDGDEVGRGRGMGGLQLVDSVSPPWYLIAGLALRLYKSM